MGSVRIGRVNDELMRVMSELIRTVRDPRVSGLVSVMRVETAPDLGSARVYISVLGDKEKEKQCVKGLCAASGYLRREAAKKLRMRHTPELVFIADNSIVTGAHIMDLIDKTALSDRKKRMLDIAGVADFLKTRDDILVLTHKSPDGDAAGSAAALVIALRAIGKNAYVFPNPEFNKKLTKCVKPYLADEEYEPACVIAVDCADRKLLSKGSEEFADSIDLAIDHHITHNPYTSLACVEPDAAACGEIIYDIVRELGVKLTKKLANAIYIAISTDTGRFLHANTTAQTHIKAAELIAHGADFENINREYFVEKSPARIAIEAEVLGGMNICFGGRVGIIKLPDETVRRLRATDDDLDGISSLARVAKGVSLGVYIHEKDGAAKISVRSDEKVDSAKFCEYFGGGGHERAAGCTMNVSVDEAEKRIIARIEELGLF